MPIGQAKFGLLGGVADPGKLELIETQTFTGVQYVDFTDIKEDIYNVHFVTWSDQRIENTTNTRLFRLLFFESGVIETATVYDQAIQYCYGNGTFGETRSTATGGIQIGGSTNNTATDNSNGFLYVYNAGDNTKHTSVTLHNTRQRNTLFVSEFGAGNLPQASIVDGFRFEQPQSNTIQGTVSLYGIAES
jgi:hypothetical protein